MTLSPDGRPIDAVLAGKIDRQTVKLTPRDRGEVRQFVADEPARKEVREDPNVLAPEQRQLAAAAIPPKPPHPRDKPRRR